jgi:hypothetical protein
MISSEVQRTLVKSPPELWSELSNPESLARHLGELGEIRIVRVEPERKIEWAAENTTGTVSIQASGWGTKVTLSVTRELVASPADTKPPAEAADAAVPDPDETPEAAVVQPTDEIEAESSSEPEPEPASAAPTPRGGFFARLFGRRRREKTAREPETSVELAVQAPRAFAAASAALAHEAVKSRVFEMPTGPSIEAAVASQANTPETQAPNRTEAGSDIAAELMAAEEVAAEEVAAEEVTAVLAAVLDRLGAAHHRPFSRS